MKKNKQVLSYFLIFVFGLCCGGGIMAQLGWSYMYRLMGAEARERYYAADESVDAMWLANILSHLRLGESEQAAQRAEWLLDVKTINAVAAASNPDAPTRRIRNANLGLVKWYRYAYPCRSELKVEATQFLSQIPDLPAPDSSTPAAHLTAIKRVYLKSKYGN